MERIRKTTIDYMLSKKFVYPNISKPHKKVRWLKNLSGFSPWCPEPMSTAFIR